MAIVALRKNPLDPFDSVYHTLHVLRVTRDEEAVMTVVPGFWPVVVLIGLACAAGYAGYRAGYAAGEKAARESKKDSGGND